jgi:putative drug exporter of the RND superfamily
MASSEPAAPDRHPSLLARLGGYVARKPRLIVAVWLLLVVVLGVRSLGLEERLSARPPAVEGSAPDRESEIVAREFGEEDALVVMLRGPREAVAEQGRELAHSLDAMRGTLVTAPWEAEGAVEGLSPSPRVAALLVSIERRSADRPNDVMPAVERRVDAVVSEPVRASVAGPPAIAMSFQEATEEAASLGERVAVPILLIVLLLVFRSAVAAVIPVLAGGAVVVASRGVLDLLLSFGDVEAFALPAVGMMGLALGVDYSLLVVSRFREEIGKRGDAAEAATITVARTGRSVIPAGCGLVLAMLVSWQLLPGSLIGSVAIAVIVVSVLSVLSALTVVPAILVLAGDRLERWALPARSARRGGVAGWSRRLSSRPSLALVAVFLLAVAAAWSATLDTDTGTVSLLPAGNEGRRHQEVVQRALGPGWLAPYEVVMDGRGSPVTTPDRLQALADFQRRVEADPGVATMTGFSRLAEVAGEPGDIDRQLAAQQRGIRRVGTGISRIEDGAALNTTGLLRAAGGARQLDAALGAAHEGAGLLVEGLGAAGGGSERLAGGLGRASEGSERVAAGTAKASEGAGGLSEGLGKAREQIDESAGSVRVLRNALKSGDRRLSEVEAPLRNAGSSLTRAEGALEAMTTGRSDPQYAVALEAVRTARGELDGGYADGEAGRVAVGVERARSQFDLGLYLADRMDRSNEDASEGIEKLASGSEKLDEALARLADGSERMSSGIEKLSLGGRELSPGLRRLSLGAERLASGLGEIGAGAGGLASGLGGGAQKSKLLTGGLRRIGAGLARQSESGGSPLDRLREESPGLFESGYFTLASLDGSDPERRSQVGFLVNLDRGGLAARMLVIPEDESSSRAALATRDRLEADAAELARRTDSDVIVGGATPNLIEIDSALRAHAGPARIALALVTFLILVPVVRSLLLPAIAALLNVLTVGAVFGLLSLLFDGALLGGPGYVDTTVIPATIMVLFGLAIDYEVFLFARMREEYLRTGSPALAIERGVARTVHVITGAALIMIVVFLAFAVSPFVTIRGFGVAQALGVAIDAFVIRLLVIPTLMGAMGRWAWWMPAWLDRLLPGGASRATMQRAAA